MKKYNDLKRAHNKVLKYFNVLINEKNILEEKVNQFGNDSYLPALLTENKTLKEKIATLTQDLAGFVSGQENLDKLLGSQKHFLDKASLGFHEAKHMFKNYFVSSSSFPKESKTSIIVEQKAILLEIA